jgi:hypothetical protein
MGLDYAYTMVNTDPERAGLRARLVPGKAAQVKPDTAVSCTAPQWVRVVSGWSDFQFAERRMRTLDEINAAAPDTLVFVLPLNGRALLNQAATKALGIGKGTPKPPGGAVQRDEAGNATVSRRPAISSVASPRIWRKIPELALSIYQASVPPWPGNDAGERSGLESRGRSRRRGPTGSSL